MRAPRLTVYLLVSVALTVLIACLQPTLMPVTLYKFSLVALAAWAGYWIDRALFPYSRPHMLRGSDKNAAALRRAVLVAAVVLAIALGA